MDFIVGFELNSEILYEPDITKKLLYYLNQLKYRI